MAETLGKRIVIEGTDATGKSYQARRLYARLSESGVAMCGFMLDEPDSPLRIDSLDEVLASEHWTEKQKSERALIPEAAEIRRKLKSKSSNFTPQENLEGFTNSRELSWGQATRPALLRGQSTVVARSDVSSTIYQGHAEGLGMDFVRSVTLQRLGEWYMNPDLLIFLDMLDEGERQRRMTLRPDDSTADAFESRPNDFQQRIKDGCIIHRETYGGILVPADGTRDEVHGLIWEEARKLFDL